jgi:hypothetical protein
MNTAVFTEAYTEIIKAPERFVDKALEYLCSDATRCRIESGKVRSGKVLASSLVKNSMEFTRREAERIAELGEYLKANNYSYLR